MKKVKIEYPFLFFFKKEKNIEVPECWMDLSGSQFAICSEAITGMVTDATFISKFYGVKTSLIKQLTKFELFKLIECAEFITNPKAMVNFFYLKSIPGTGLYSPEKRLQNVSFEHFMLFDTFFFDYVNDPKESNLHKFVAALYLKKGEVLTSIDFQKRISYIAKNVDKASMDAIFLNYTFIRKWLSSVFKFLFEYNEQDPEEKHEKDKQPITSNKPDWNSILDGFIGEDILNEQEYRSISCIRAFKTINKRIQIYRTNGK